MNNTKTGKATVFSMWGEKTQLFFSAGLQLNLFP